MSRQFQASVASTKTRKGTDMFATSRTASSRINHSPGTRAPTGAVLIGTLFATLLPLLPIEIWPTGAQAASGQKLAAEGSDNPGDHAGKLLYNNSCRTCHSTSADDNRLGPNLADIVGRPAGAAQGYAYSSAMKSADFEWTVAKLDDFIANPDAVVPGHNMKPFTGIVDAGRRDSLIDYLKNPG